MCKPRAQVEFLLPLPALCAAARFGLDLGATPEVRVHEAGIVTRRPYTHSLIPWDDVDHVRLREGELVLDRGLFDVRFDRGELEDADAVYEALERRLSAR